MVYGIYNELVTGANLNQQTSLGGLIYSDSAWKNCWRTVGRAALRSQGTCCNAWAHAVTVLLDYVWRYCIIFYGLVL